MVYAKLKYCRKERKNRQHQFSMRGVIVVESDIKYKTWLSLQSPEYKTIFKNITADSTAAQADTIKTPLAKAN
mgnify:CR=1 FL=1